MSDFNNDPKLIDELLHVRADNSSLCSQVEFLKGQNEFLRQIILSLIQK